MIHVTMLLIFALLSIDLSPVPSSFRLSTLVFHMGPLGKPTCKKSEVFLNIVQKAFDPPPSPFYLNICPILQGVFFKRVFEH